MPDVDSSESGFVVAVSVVGLVTGLVLLGRGFGGYRRAGRIADTASSTISSLAAGDVRVSGVVEPAELRLVSLLQSEPCVYYRSTVDADGRGLGGGLGDDDVLEERSVGFAVHDASGSIRVFPRGARIEAPVRWEDSTGMLGDEPPGLRWRLGSAVVGADPDRDAAVAALLTMPATSADDPHPVSVATASGKGSSRRAYRESRLEPGDEITILGQAIPFGDLDDPANADLGGGGDPEVPGGDAEVAADLEAARASGTLLTDPEAAWGNAAIPGFGIGRPTREPVLDPAAHDLPLASPAEAARAARRFEIAPETLVLASIPDSPLLITYGSPGAAASREGSTFRTGLLGATLAIVSAVALAWTASGGVLR